MGKGRSRLDGGPPLASVPQRLGVPKGWFKETSAVEGHALRGTSASEGQAQGLGLGRNVHEGVRPPSLPASLVPLAASPL